MMFLELIDENNMLVTVNVNKIESFRPWLEGTKLAFGNGFIVVRNSYDEVKELLKGMN